MEEGQEMAAALVEVDEVRVEATLVEPDGVKVRPEVRKPQFLHKIE